MFNIEVITKVERYEEVMTEGDKAISNCDRSCSMRTSYRSPYFSCLFLVHLSLCMASFVTIPSYSSSRVLLVLSQRAGRCESSNPGGGTKTHSILEGVSFADVHL